MTVNTLSRQENSQALVSNDKKAWEAHMKKRAREKEFDVLKNRVSELEAAVDALNLYIKERIQ